MKLCTSVFVILIGGACSGIGTRTPALVPTSNVFVHRGTTDRIGAASCYGTLELFERDVRLSPHTEAAVAKRLNLRACPSRDSHAMSIIYQAGPGTCIDCGEQRPAGWSGFAFLSVANAEDRESVSVEWHGAGADSARTLRELFIADVGRMRGLLRPGS